MVEFRELCSYNLIKHCYPVYGDPDERIMIQMVTDAFYVQVTFIFMTLLQVKMPLYKI